jgi:signal transduction histidine kinase
MDKSKNLEELMLAHEELIFKHDELVKCAAELTTANKELVFQHSEKDKQTTKLKAANDSLKKSEEHQQEHIQGMEKIMYMISHEVRQPVVNIIGLSNVIDNDNNTPEELKKIAGLMKQSAQALDTFTRDLSKYIQEKQNESENII